MNKLQESAQAQILGNIAFNDGKKSAPCLDRNFMDMLKDKKLGESNHILKAWNHGWHQANLAT